MESPLLSFGGNPEASSSNLFLGLEWPSLMPPFNYQNQETPIQGNDVSSILNDGGFGLLEQNNVDVMIDPDLLTLRPARCTNTNVDG